MPGKDLVLPKGMKEGKRQRDIFGDSKVKFTLYECE